MSVLDIFLVVLFVLFLIGLTHVVAWLWRAESRARQVDASIARNLRF